MTRPNAVSPRARFGNPSVRQRLNDTGWTDGDLANLIADWPHMPAPSDVTRLLVLTQEYHQFLGTTPDETRRWLLALLDHSNNRAGFSDFIVSLIQRGQFPDTEHVIAAYRQVAAGDDRLARTALLAQVPPDELAALIDADAASDALRLLAVLNA